MKPTRYLKGNHFQLLLMVLIWLFIFMTPFLFSEFEEGVHWEHIFSIWINNGLILALFIFNRYILLPRFLFMGKKRAYLSIISGSILILAVVLFINKPEEIENEGPRRLGPPPQMEFRQMPPPMQHGQDKEGIPPFANFLIMSILIIGFDTGLAFYSKWMQSEQNRVQSEKDSIENKMAFLKNQVSPHFFMNTLNNIHALVDISTEEAKTAIIKLSKMMGYMLYDSQSEDILLKQEIEFIHSYVELMKLRLSDEIDLVLEIPSVVAPVRIPPLLTISFIENAFKHGVSYEHPSFVHILYTVTETDLFVDIKNSIHRKNEDKAYSGIGLQNTINRLDLTYGKNYDLNISDSEDKGYEVNLRIPL